jgi:TldD protein
MITKDLEQRAQYALDVAKGLGAGYADVRLIISEAQMIEAKDTAVVGLDEDSSFGIGIRVLWQNMGWGFAATPHVSKRGIEKAVRRAIEIAKVSAQLATTPIVLVPEVAHKDTWSSPCEIDPFTISTDDKVALLLNATATMHKVKGITVASGSMEFRREYKLFASTEGAHIKQTVITSGFGIEASATADGDTQVRSYPFALGGQYENRGWESVLHWDMPGNAERIASEAVAILKAPVCREGVMDLILGSSQMAMQLHESCGHPCELDRENGWEMNYAGGTFLTRDKLGKLMYGSPIVNISADGTVAGGLGSFKYDDEGVEAQKYYLVKNGLFVGFLSSRETAHLVGLNRSGGAMRAASFADMPLIRMTNVSLEPGNSGSLEDLIADTKRGIFMDACTSWSIDSQRHHFQFSTEVGWEIKNGKRTRLVRMPSYEGFTTKFWNSCDAICGESEYRHWGCDSCAKGQPEQAIGTGHGAAPARFRKVKVGVAQND